MSIPSLPAPPPGKRVIAYIDGFNLYYGLKERGWERFLWLDLPVLARSLIKKQQDLIQTKYFTSRIATPASKQKRQSIYLEAVKAHCGNHLKMYFGYYQFDPWKCDSCGRLEKVPSEKKTDVNIAVEIMTDAFSGLFDTALIISADGDLVPAVLAVKRLFPDKRIVIAFPPKRHSVELKREAHASFTIGRARFPQAQMPETVIKPSGIELSRPKKWTASRTELGKALGTALGLEE